MMNNSFSSNSTRLLAPRNRALRLVHAAPMVTSRSIPAATDSLAADEPPWSTAWLRSLGVTELDDDLSSVLVDQLRSITEQAVGVELAASFSDEQLDQFMAFVEVHDSAGAARYLRRAAPHYRLVVERNVNLVAEVLRATTAALAGYGNITPAVGRTARAHLRIVDGRSNR
jgi:hypothetical protein